MPVESGRASVGGQGKAAPVDPTTVQLQLPIATAEVPKAIVNAETATSVTMEAMSLPPSSHNWLYGDRSRSITGRRRGS
jgi:hypothetical protein